jgi:D-inositol-3-phosphate glycosyltransferase
VVGGPSGSGLEHPTALADLAADLGIADVVRFVPPVTQSELAVWSSAATAVAVPSYNESFGLVAVEAQATGTPVVVRDGVSGLLVDTHDPRDWAATLRRLVDDPALVERLGRGAVAHAQDFSWERTAERTLEAYERAGSRMHAVMAS